MATEEIITGITTAAGSTVAGSITVATITSTVPASGVLGWFGVTTTVTSVITLPVSGIIATGVFLIYVGYKAYKNLKRKE